MSLAHPVRHALRKSRAVLSRLRRSTSGVAMIIFAGGLIPLLVAGGMAIDYGNLIVARNRAQVAADSVVLFATGAAKAQLIKSGGDNADTILAEVKARAETMFGAYDMGSVHSISKPTVTLTRDGQDVTAEISFAVTTPTYFVRLIGYDTLSSGGSAEAVSSVPRYIDIYMLLDTSQSMGLASSDAGMTELFKLTTPNCQFGCHSPTSSQKTSNQSIAVANNIELRIDVLRNATRDLVERAKDLSGSQGLYRVGLYPIHWNLDPFTALSPITENLDQVLTDTAKVTLGNNNADGVGDTDFPFAMNSMASHITIKGNGSSRAQARPYLFIITDGVRDVKGGCTYGHCTSVFDPALCKTYKDQGVTVGVIYTTFLPVKERPDQAWNTALRPEYRDLVLPFAGQIKPALEECASSGWFFEASDGPAIQVALQKLFEQTSRDPGLIE